MFILAIEGFFEMMGMFFIMIFIAYIAGVIPALLAGIVHGIIVEHYNEKIALWIMPMAGYGATIIPLMVLAGWDKEILLVGFVGLFPALILGYLIWRARRNKEPQEDHNNEQTSLVMRSCLLFSVFGPILGLATLFIFSLIANIFSINW